MQIKQCLQITEDIWINPIFNLSERYSTKKNVYQINT